MATKASWMETAWAAAATPTINRENSLEVAGASAGTLPTYRGTGCPRRRELFLQIRVHDGNEFLCRDCPRIVVRGARVNHVLADVILYQFRNESVQSTATGGCLLQDLCAFVIRLYCPLDGIDLPA